MHKRYVRHLLFWACYLLFESYVEFAWISHEHAGQSVWQRIFMASTAETLQMFLIKIPLVYALFWILNKSATRQTGRLAWLAGALPVFLTACLLDRILIVQVLLPRVYQNFETVGIFDFQRFINTFLDLVFIAGVAIALKQYSLGGRMREKERLLIREKLETELNFLKSQINPHFLFNTLNNIYSLARKKSDDTADAVVKLSKLLRFMLYDAQNADIGVEHEIRLLHDYLEIEKMRYGDRLDLRFAHQTDDPEARIAPLILIPLVENAFKHGAGETTAETFIHLDLRVANGVLFFSVENKIEENLPEKVKEGIGLKNLRRRLELVYKTFELSTFTEPTRFRATLNIVLDQTHAY